MKISVKDFFLQLGAIGTLYASLIAVIILLFRVINVSYPQITNGNYYNPQNISFQVATLLVSFPLFLLLSWLLQKSLKGGNEKDFVLRRWLSYLTLFIAGIVIAGDLISVLYTFLDGQELTKAFLLKALVLIIVAGGVFMYFLQDIRNKLSTSNRNLWRIISSAFMIGSIILGFSILGSPTSQRLQRYDLQKLSDLQNIQWQIVNYYQQKTSLPDSLDSLNDPISSWMTPRDPQTNEAYQYEKTGNLAFNLCANFNKESQAGQGLRDGSIAMPTYGPSPIGKGGENWSHQSGMHCFERTIDPQLYPPSRR
jgi:glucan phosphoethanolaminetransferase (alkaline phosphatase superfamily)